MFLAMLRFELRYFLRQPSFYVVSFLLFLISFFSVASDNVVLGGGGEVFKNSPYSIAQTLLLLSLFAMFLVVNFVGSGAVRNAQHQMEELIYTKPLPAFSYQFGRFFGSYLVVLLVYLAVPAGMLLGSFMPWVDASRFGPTQLEAYIYNFVALSVPGLFVLSALFYAAAVRFRSLMPLYLIAVVLLVLYAVSGSFARLPEFRTLAALADPFGLRTFMDVTRYWTIQEKNSQLVPFAGVLLQNRVLWTLIAFGLLALAGLFRLPGLQQRDTKKASAKVALIPQIDLNRVQQKSTLYSTSSALWCRIKFEMRQVLWTAPFFILLVISMVQLIGPLFADFGWYGTSEWPVTQTLVMHIVEALSLLIIIVTVYYSAEVVWRERNSGMGDIIDTMPVPNLTFWLAKLLAVAAVMLLLMLLGMVCTIGYQLLKGVVDVELSQYLIRLIYQYGLPTLLTVMLAFFLQVLSPNKFVGMGLFVGYYLLSLVMSNWGLGHSLLNFAMSPNVGFSDLNQYGPNLVTHSWYMLYWGAISLVLFTLGYGLYHRGPAQSLRQRWRKIGYQLGGTGKTIIVASVLVACGTGTFLWQQTTVLNSYQTADQRRDQQAGYEKQFVQYAEMAFPVTTKVDAALDLYPEQQKVVAKVALSWQNKSDQPIDKVLVNWPENTADMQIRIAGASLSERDDQFRTSWLTFAPALQPGQTVSGEIELVRQSVGLRETNFDSTVVENGTFINNWELLPSFGYQQRYELQDRHERQKRDLQPNERANKLEDSRFYNQSFFGADGDFIQFSATVSTAGDQTAITPGYLQRQWQQDGRNYFRYEMDQPMVNFYSVSSGRYAVKTQQHNGVAIEVYYHPAHHWNVDRMMESVRDSLDYFTAEFGPYQHKQMRIIEFPGYRSFAQSFANTVPYSERIGFTTDLRDSDNIDPVYYVTAHEVAHQWWGHQVGAADVQGSAVISESLSQYAALMVMQHKYGADKIRKFMKHELDDYLRGRSAERIAEMPLLRAENQAYIHYQKGSVVMMAIKDLLGEARLNANLKAFNARYRFRNDPFPTTLDLLQYLTQNTSAEEAAFIRDQFENITLYDLRLQQAKAVQLDDGRYQISLTIYAEKLRADERGNQSPEPMQQLVSIGLFSADPDKINAEGGQLYLQQHLLQSGENQLQIVLEQLPVYAGVDPYINLIDRDGADNILRVDSQ
ncbi:ABC transporter permease/M1 family aminopeptidase [Rheinheimera maricola]|uniref:ABC transporter permease n=1 Tax=Rheinheimera maricola TaxID=2793282 RepID=A0ABS7XCG4_9GAMM|nr:M1 family aminopeptidase [Rheinheimera maricola]MBZ9612418.1 ABC transporter permease [Rheinheimera maricola]